MYKCDNLVLTNGVKVEVLTIGMISIDINHVEITLDGFSNTELASKSTDKISAMKSQEKLLAEFQILSIPTEMNDAKRQKLQALQKEINTLADVISKSSDYSRFVIFNKTYNIPFSEEINEEYIISELNKIEELKGFTKIEEVGE